jgi:hypothetical protein
MILERFRRRFSFEFESNMDSNESRRFLLALLNLKQYISTKINTWQHEYISGAEWARAGTWERSGSHRILLRGKSDPCNILQRGCVEREIKHYCKFDKHIVTSILGGPEPKWCGLGSGGGRTTGAGDTRRFMPWLNTRHFIPIADPCLYTAEPNHTKSTKSQVNGKLLN